LTALLIAAVPLIGAGGMGAGFALILVCSILATCRRHEPVGMARGGELRATPP